MWGDRAIVHLFQAVPVLDYARTLGFVNVKDVVRRSSLIGGLDVDRGILGTHHNASDLAQKGSAKECIGVLYF